MPLTAHIESSLTLLDKVNVCLQTFGDHVMHLVFDVDGKIDLPRFNRAIRLSLIETPIMAQRLEFRWGQPRWTYWCQKTLDQTLFCEEIAAETADKQQRVHEFLVRSVDFSTQPMVLARIIRGDTETLCIKVSCVPIDGRGFLIYVERLLALYERLSDDAGFTPPPGTLSLRSTRALVHYFRPVDLIKLVYFSLRNQIQDHSTAKHWRFPCAEGKPLDKAYYCHTLSAGSMQRINLLRSHYQLTFNDILLGAYYLALYEIIKPQQEKPFCILNTYDLRRYEVDQAPERVANYSSFINTNVTLNACDDLLSAARKVKHSIDQRKRHYPGITEAPFIWPILSLLPFSAAQSIVKRLLKSRGEMIPVFTNVGIIDTNNMRLNRAPIYNVMPFAPLEYPPKLTVTLATAGNRITLSTGYSRNHFPPPLLQRLFTRVESLIDDAVHAKGSRAA